MSCPSRHGSRSVVKVVDRHGVRRCGVCGATRPIKKRADADQPDQCARCWAASPRSWTRCEICGQSGRIKGRTPDGGPLCVRCYDRGAPTDRCEDCGPVRKLRVRGSSGGPRLCARCYRHRRPPRRCDGCGRVREIVARATEQDPRDLCHSCFEKARARRCGICGEVKPISRKARDGQPDICTACAHRLLPLAVCTQCGQRKPCLFPEGASPICRRCRELTYYARHPCALCGEHRRAAWRSPIGAVCGPCMSRHLGSRAVCESCGELRRPAPPTRRKPAASAVCVIPRRSQAGGFGGRASRARPAPEGSLPVVEPELPAGATVASRSSVMSARGQERLARLTAVRAGSLDRRAPLHSLPSCMPSSCAL
jgi:hypothetical protein